MSILIVTLHRIIRIFKRLKFFNNGRIVSVCWIGRIIRSIRIVRIGRIGRIGRIVKVDYREELEVEYDGHCYQDRSSSAESLTALFVSRMRDFLYL